MSTAKVVVLYPYPKDVAAFEKVYMEEHLPMVAQKISGMTKAVLTKFHDTPQGKPPFYRSAELYFPSMEALQTSLASEATQQVAAHVVSISTGGAPLILVAEEETTPFNQKAAAPSPR